MYWTLEAHCQSCKELHKSKKQIARRTQQHLWKWLDNVSGQEEGTWPSKDAVWPVEFIQQFDFHLWGVLRKIGRVYLFFNSFPFSDAVWSDQLLQQSVFHFRFQHLQSRGFVVFIGILYIFNEDHNRRKQLKKCPESQHIYFSPAPAIKAMASITFHFGSSVLMYWMLVSLTGHLLLMTQLRS